MTSQAGTGSGSWPWHLCQYTHTSLAWKSWSRSLVHNQEAKKPLLEQLFTSIPWESFRSLLDQGYAQERKSSAGRKRIDPLILFKILILQ